ncbi:hypothetical protein HHK36_029843 [Tetracentron sinense]|uniref:Strictosidine synthase conserved region domain-containing protein n=1 Tax=Tetracentron sinense TaxID=13715 RepID=A0A834YAB8_TETSI|nr:hypothetical protein HHK36_029843 [Tetracentron sinense]
MVAMHTIFTIFFCIISFTSRVSALLESCYKLQLPSPVLGPEALAFDRNSEGPYTGVSDGRVLKWKGSSLGFVDFAITSQNRSKELCDGSSDPALENNCGRSLGLGFYNRTGELSIADAYFGLLVVGSNGGVATQLATSAEGVPFRFLNSLDVDQGTGIVYFTDASARFQRSGDMTGRLMKYNPMTKQVTVLLRGLAFAAGTAVSKDGAFVVVTEAIASRIVRFWLQGPKANTSEVFAQLLVQPDNIKSNARGDFWVAANTGKEECRKEALPSSLDREEKVTLADADCGT